MQQPAEQSGSKLASLFDMDSRASNAGNASLTFRAPKAPKEGAPTQALPPPSHKPAERAPPPTSANPQAPAMSFASTCNLFQFANGAFQPITGASPDGKLGLVVMPTGQGRVMSIMAYDQNKTPILTTVIGVQFKATSQPGNYISFRDNLNNVWSMLMKSEQDLEAFMRAVALARSAAWTDESYPLIAQESVVGGTEAREAKESDRVSIRVQGWVEGEAGRGSMGEAIPQEAEGMSSFQMGSGAVIQGWEDGVKGMRVGGRRWLVVPPHLAYGEEGCSSPSIPPHSVLIFHVTLLDVQDGEPEPTKAEESIPLLPGEGGTTISEAIKGMRPPSEDGDGDEWSDDDAEEVGARNGNAKSEAIEEPSEDASEPAEVEQSEGGGEGETMQPSMDANDQDKDAIKARMAKLSGGGNPMIITPHPDSRAADEGRMEFASEAPRMDSGPVMEILKSSHKEQQGLVSNFSTMMEHMIEVKAKLNSLVEAREAKPSAELLMGQVLVESVSKLVDDKDSLRIDVMKLKEKLEDSAYQLRQVNEEKKRLEEALAKQTEAYVNQTAEGAGAEGLKSDVRRLEADLEAARKAREDALSELDEAHKRHTESNQEAKAAKQAQKLAEERAKEAEEALADVEAARDKAEEDRKKLRKDLVREREKWQGELEEERQGVDKQIQELRDSIRRLRLQGAGAREEELEELQKQTEERVLSEAKECEDAVRRELEASQKEVEASQKEVESLRQQVSQLEADVKRAGAKELESVERTAGELAEVKGQLERERQESQDKFTALQEEREASEAAIASAAKAKIDKVRETAKNQLPAKLKDVASRAYFKLEEVITEEGGPYSRDRVLSLVLDNLKAATLEATGEATAEQQKPAAAVEADREGEGLETDQERAERGTPSEQTVKGGAEVNDAVEAGRSEGMGTEGPQETLQAANGDPEGHKTDQKLSESPPAHAEAVAVEGPETSGLNVGGAGGAEGSNGVEPVADVAEEAGEGETEGSNGVEPVAVGAEGAEGAGLAEGLGAEEVETAEASGGQAPEKKKGKKKKR